ncbi:MAG: hypothetical protein QG630_37 [Patescibacteria group bacterium]|nr:hypothetical protein [Patescibacteria group bacterium]
MSTFKFPVSRKDFKKSSWSKNNPKTCVEVAIKPEGVAMLDSKNPNGKILFFKNDEWQAFISGVKNKEFDI